MKENELESKMAAAMLMESAGAHAGQPGLRGPDALGCQHWASLW